MADTWLYSGTPLKGHLCIEDTMLCLECALPGPQGVHNREVPLYVQQARDGMY